MMFKKSLYVKDIVDFLIISLFIFLTAGASSILKSNLFFIIITVFLFFVFYFRRCKIDNVIIIVSLVWILINILSYFINDVNTFLYYPIVGYLLRIFISYFIIKIVGEKFFDKLYNYAYKLTIISLIFFCLQQIISNIYYALSSYLNFMTYVDQKIIGGWYIFIYMFNGNALGRNCGFCFEPTGFAGVLIFLILYNLIINKLKKK